MPDEVTVEGTVSADGTLLLDDKVSLPAGRVVVTVQSVSSIPPNDPFWQTMQRIWANQKARGHVPRTRQEIDEEIMRLRDDAEAGMQTTERLYEECRRAREQAKQGPKAT